MGLIGFFKRSRHPTKVPQDDLSIHILRDAAMDAQRSRLPQMAAALSYRTLFGLLPILAVGMVILHKFADPAQLRSLITQLVDAAGLRSIVLDEGQIVGPPLPGELVDASATPASLDQWITGLINHVNDINFAAIGVIGGIMLLYSAASMIMEVELAFNQIYRVPRGRSIIRQLTNYTTLIVWGPLCLFATFWLQYKFSGWVDSFDPMDPWRTWLGISVQTAGLGISIALLVVLYTVVPNTKVNVWAAIIGATLAGLLFEMGKWGFGYYVEFSAKTSYARLYGSLGLIPLFMLWVYVTWFIVLFGLQVTYQLQHGRGKTRAQPIADFGPAVVEPASGLLVMSAIARGFSTGSPQTAHELATVTGLPESTVRIVLARLSEHTLVLRVDRQDGPGNEPTYTLARAPGAIRVGEVLSIGFELSSGPESNPMLQRMRQAQIDAAGAETLAQAAGLMSDGTASGAATTGAATTGTAITSIAPTPETYSVAATPRRVTQPLATPPLPRPLITPPGNPSS